MEERRTSIRRVEDRDRLAALGKSTAELSEKKIEQRKMRRAIRHACKAELTIEISHQRGNSEEWVVERQKLPGRVLDLSEEGAAFFIRYPATTNQSFQFQINLAGGGFIQGQADVRWVKQKDSAKGFAIGSRFTRIDNANLKKVKVFLDELDATLGLGAESL